MERAIESVSPVPVPTSVAGARRGAGLRMDLVHAVASGCGQGHDYMVSDRVEVGRDCYHSTGYLANAIALRRWRTQAEAVWHGPESAPFPRHLSRATRQFVA